MKHVLLWMGLLASASHAHAIRFEKACDPGDRVLIGAVGDVLLHGPLQKQGYKSGFESLWADIAEFIAGPDFMYANLEGPAAAGVNKSGKSVKDPGPVFDGNVYSGYPLFNYHPSIVEDLKTSGFDLVSTANNHSMDRGNLGVKRTIEALETHGLMHMGTRTDGQGEFHLITQDHGWKIAWIACTYDTNGLPDNSDLVLECFDGRVSQLIKDIKPSVDAVIITPHWGSQYELQPSAQQKKFGRQWIEDGAAAVIGAHPHVPQPWEKYKAKDQREGLILYSLGNFVSNQSGVAKQSSLVLFVGLTKKRGQAWVNGVRYLPLHMNRAPYQAVASNLLAQPNSQQKASLKLLKDMFGDERIVAGDEAVIPNAECPQ